MVDEKIEAIVDSFPKYSFLVKMLPFTDLASWLFKVIDFLLPLRRVLSGSSQNSNFAQEIRLMVHLRHPAITTVMGACVAKNRAPLLVMGKRR